MSFELPILLKTDLAAISVGQRGTDSNIGAVSQRVHAKNDREPGRNHRLILVYSGSVVTGF